MIEARAGWPAAGGAGERVERKFGQSLPPGCSATRPEAASPRRTSPVARIGACENSRFRGSSLSPDKIASGQRDYADPPLRRVLLFQGFGVAASRNEGR